jgi:CheY-like chemotaxis protein
MRPLLSEDLEFWKDDVMSANPPLPRALPERILVIEDNPMDVKFLRHIFEHEQGWNPELIVVEDGEEAIEYLLHPDVPKPDLVVLDLNLPKRDGTEVLKAIRADSHLYGLRVAVFSSSPEDVMKAKVTRANLQADDYISKPIGFSECASLAKRFHQCCESSSSLERRSNETQVSASYTSES